MPVLQRGVRAIVWIASRALQHWANPGFCTIHEEPAGGSVLQPCAWQAGHNRTGLQRHCTCFFGKTPHVRILYVEDNRELRETIAMLMEGPGRTVVACSSAEEALAHGTRQGSCDLLVTDVNLPGMSGTELSRQLLTRDARQRVVLCSGYDVGAELSGFGPRVRMLHKPFDIDVLETLLDEIQAEVEASQAG